MTAGEFKQNVRKKVRVKLPQQGIDGVYELRGCLVMDIGERKPNIITSVIVFDDQQRQIQVPIESVEVMECQNT